MEEKYPIHFSFSQFILLMSVGVVLLIFVFLMGAKFGAGIFSNSQEMVAHSELEGLKPDQPVTPKNKLSSNEGNAELGQSSGFGMEVNPANEAVTDHANIAVAKQVQSPLQKTNTMVRIKSSTDSIFSLEIDSISNETQAAAELEQWKRKGYPTYLALEQISGQQFYKIRVGSFGDRQDAEGYANRLREKEGVEVKIVQAE